LDSLKIQDNLRDTAPFLHPLRVHWHLTENGRDLLQIPKQEHFLIMVARVTSHHKRSLIFLSRVIERADFPVAGNRLLVRISIMHRVGKVAAKHRLQI
jgi:hypothetical protein